MTDDWQNVSNKLTGAENENANLTVQLEKAINQFNHKKGDHDFVQMKLTRE